MPNYKAKGVETMRALGRVGGKKSGEARRKNAVQRRMLDLVGVWEIRKHLTFEQVEEEAARGFPNASGGSHDTDWRCPGCHQFHSAKRWFCRRCGRVILKRTTRKRLQELEAARAKTGILRGHGLDCGPSGASSDSQPDPLRSGTAAPGVDRSPAMASRPPGIWPGALAKLDLIIPADLD